VPRLIVLNGPPACGKSTLARRYAEEHPLALNLDIDRIRDLIGGWRTNLRDAGLLARAAALAAARAHLTAGHDVIVPQLLARPDFLDQAAALATSTGASFHEIVLMDTRENALRRWSLRSATAAPVAVVAAAAAPAAVVAAAAVAAAASESVASESVASESVASASGALLSSAAASGPPPAEREEIAALYDRLQSLLPARPGARIVHSHENEIERTYREVISHLE
jgi:predicted kinase